MKSRKIFYCCFLFFTLTAALHAQGDGNLSFVCKVTDSKSLPLKDVKVRLMKGSKALASINTNKTGVFVFHIFFDDVYKVTFSRPGYIDMFILIEASAAQGEIFPSYKTQVSMIPDTTTGIDPEKYKDPFLKLIFDGKGNFSPDEEYAAGFNKSITPDTPPGKPASAKSNYPEKFAFADANNDNAISANELGEIAALHKSDVVDELIDWFFE